jgi:hypothetical protein
MALLTARCKHNACTFKSGTHMHKIHSHINCDELVLPRGNWTSNGPIADSLSGNLAKHNYFYCSSANILDIKTVTLYPYFANFHITSESPIYTDNFILSKNGQLQYFKHGQYKLDELKSAFGNENDARVINLFKKIEKSIELNSKKTTDVW